MEHLQSGQLGAALGKLKKAEAFIKEMLKFHPTHQATLHLSTVTFNNFGCYYKK